MEDKWQKCMCDGSSSMCMYNFLQKLMRVSYQWTATATTNQSIVSRFSSQLCSLVGLLVWACTAEHRGFISLWLFLQIQNHQYKTINLHCLLHECFYRGDILTKLYLKYYCRNEAFTFNKI